MASIIIFSIIHGITYSAAGYSQAMTSVLQYIAWWIALAQFITGLYALYLNPRLGSGSSTGSRLRPLAITSAFLIALALYTFAIGSMVGTEASVEGTSLARATGSSAIAQAERMAMLIAAVAPLLAPLFLLASILLVQPTLLKKRGASGKRASVWSRWFYRLQIPLYVLWSLPVWLTIADGIWGTGFWYTGLPHLTYIGGYLPLSQFTGGKLGALIIALNFTLPWIATAIVLIVASFRGLGGRKESAEDLLDVTVTTPGTTIPPGIAAQTRRIAWVLLAAFTISTILGGFQGSSLYSLPAGLLSSLFFLFAFAYVTFQAVSYPALTGQPDIAFPGTEDKELRTSGREPARLPAEPAPLSRRSRYLETRLTILVIIVTLPSLIAMGAFLTKQARRNLEQDAIQSLISLNQSVYNSTAIWLDYNQKALENLVTSPDIMSMDADRQKALLKQMAAAYPHMYLISTTDLNGKNVARNDDEALRDYSDRQWFQDARIGVPVSYQTLLGRTSGQPAVVVSMPIRQPQSTDQTSGGRIVGVGMFASDLDQVSKLIRDVALTSPNAGEGSPAVIYIIDQNNQLVAHPDPTLTAELTDMSSAPPVSLLRQGEAGNTRFIDENGKAWRAETQLLPNGWAIVVQARESDLFAPIRVFQRFSAIILFTGTILLLVFAWLTIRQGLRPIQTLTATARAITAGDFSRLAPVESQDELGVLAQAMNQMTAQLTELIGGLENRVAERTHDLERRAIQLQVAAEVAREASAFVGAMATTGRSDTASSESQLEELLDNVVNLISERFGHYHAGIFLITEPGSPESRAEQTASEAVLYAASSQGGKRMLEKGHCLKVGQVGIVGYVAGSGLPRIALDVGKDAVFFNNPELPQTRSEMALPLKIGGAGSGERVIGILDVQSKRPAAFTEEDIAILQILADQVALAIHNIRLLTESQQSLRELERLYGYQTHQGWQRRVADKPLAYVLSTGVIQPLSEQKTTETPGGGNGGTASESIEQVDREPGSEIEVPIELRGQRLGVLHLRRSSEEQGWTPEEKELLRESMSQLALSLENARLLEEVQNRARQEELINQIVARTQSSLNLETVMKTAVQEIGQVLNVARVQLRLGPEGTVQPISADHGPPEKQEAAVQHSPPKMNDMDPQASEEPSEETE